MTKTHGTAKEFRSCTLVIKVYLNASTCTASPPVNGTLAEEKSRNLDVC